MSLAVSRSDGLTVLTLTSDPSSACPPFCQLFGALCYRPASVSRHLLRQRGGPQAVLGALWIITGLLHNLGVILIKTREISVYTMRGTYCPVWLGVFFMFFGVSCVLTERYPRRTLVLLNGLLNLTGFALSFTAIMWYSSGSISFYNYCGTRGYSWDRPVTTTASPEQSALLERCVETKDLLRVLAISIRAVLITLSVLDLCLAISSATLSFKTLKQGLSRNKPLLKEDKATPE